MLDIIFKTYIVPRLAHSRTSLGVTETSSFYPKEKEDCPLNQTNTNDRRISIGNKTIILKSEIDPDKTDIWQECHATIIDGDGTRQDIGSPAFKFTGDGGKIIRGSSGIDGKMDNNDDTIVATAYMMALNGVTTGTTGTNTAA